MGSGAEKKAGSGEVRCVAAGTASGSAAVRFRRHFIRRIIVHRIPLITAFECSFRESDSYHVISKYKQSDWFSRFLVMLSQQAQDFGQSVPDTYPS